MTEGSRGFSFFDLIDDGKCYDMIRSTRWGGEVKCVECGGGQIQNNGVSRSAKNRWRYLCSSCGKHFDDLTGLFFLETVFRSRAG